MIQKYYELLYNILQKLVEADTVNPPGNERNAAVVLYNLLKSYNIDCELQELGNNRANFIAQIGEGQPVFEFNGHLDVVPFTDDWNYNALNTTKKEDKIYGRGTCDMKGGLSAMTAAMIALSEEKVKLNGTLRLTFFADEECLSIGAHAFYKKYKPAQIALIGEPTNLNIAIANRGVVRHQVDIKGKARHAALNPIDDTAMTDAAKAILALQQANINLQKQTHSVLPPPGISITMVHGYEKDNIVPAKVRLLVDSRVHPKTTYEQSLKVIVDVLENVGIKNYETEKLYFLQGGEVPPDDAFVQKCCDITQKILNRPQKPIEFGATCEQSFLLNAGTKAIIFGPGSLKQAHITNEFVPCKEFEKSLDCYFEIAKYFLQ